MANCTLCGEKLGIVNRLNPMSNTLLCNSCLAKHRNFMTDLYNKNWDAADKYLADIEGMDIPAQTKAEIKSEYNDAKGISTEDEKVAEMLQRQAEVTEAQIQEELANISANEDDRARGLIYSIQGNRGRRIKIYEDKVEITVDVTVGSILTGNSTDGEKTIYYVDCVGLQYKDSGYSIGYLQLETAGGLMNNEKSNFFNENTFTFDTVNISNKAMQIVAADVKERISAIKRAQVASYKMGVADALLKFKDLLDAGVITQEEFDSQKANLLL